jgi:hypothetical protein
MDDTGFKVTIVRDAETRELQLNVVMTRPIAYAVAEETRNNELAGLLSCKIIEALWAIQDHEDEEDDTNK